MKRLFATAAVGLFAVAGTAGTITQAGAAPGEVTRVTTDADSGPGSLREALASDTAIIVVDPSIDTITLESPLTRTVAAPLRLQGNGVTIDADGVYHGLHVIVPADATGTVDVTLQDLTVTGSGLHGIYVDDNLGSPASIALSMIQVTADANGLAESDQDGVRVDERELGSISFTSRGSTFSRAGADGVELDETGDGDVVLDVQGSTFVDNGPFDPGDLDDGIDVDETDGGSLLGSIRSSQFIHNYDEGIDLNEEGAGSVDVSMVNVVADSTVDGDGIAVEEADEGDLVVSVVASASTNNGDDGIQVEQADTGTGTLKLRSTDTNGNADDPINLDNVAQA
jgi:hypothetical protein